MIARRFGDAESAVESSDGWRVDDESGWCSVDGRMRFVLSSVGVAKGRCVRCWEIEKAWLTHRKLPNRLRRTTEETDAETML